MPGVISSSYCGINQIQGIVGDLVTSRLFTDGTSPSTTEVETAIEDVAGEINSHLATSGYTTPVDHEAFPDAWKLMALANSFGAAAQVLMSRPGVSFSEFGAPNDRAGFYHKRLTDILKQIDARKIKAGSSSDKYFEPFAGSQETADGDKKLPIFTRDVTDNPGSRDLTE